jgi:hypothetical protein
MALIVCPLCVREDDVHLLRTLPDGRKEAECRDCAFTFTYGSPTPEAKPAAPRRASTRAPRVVVPRVEPLASVKRRFPTADLAAPDALQRAEELKREFLAEPYVADAAGESSRAKFRWVFSEAGLEKAVISDLRLFVTEAVADSTELDKAWLLLGELESGRRVRAMFTHLLRGPGELEDRLTALLDGSFGQAMPGVGEPALTRALAVSDPDRFLPIDTYEQKRDLASAVYDLQLPTFDEASFTAGRLAVWGNDLLVELAGDGFEDLHHAARFLVWARGQ